MNLNEDLLKKVVYAGRVCDPPGNEAVKLGVVFLPNGFNVGHQSFSETYRVGGDLSDEGYNN